MVLSTLRVSPPSSIKPFWTPPQICPEVYLLGNSESSQIDKVKPMTGFHRCTQRCISWVTPKTSQVDKINPMTGLHSTPLIGCEI